MARERAPVEASRRNACKMSPRNALTKQNKQFPTLISAWLLYRLASRALRRFGGGVPVPESPCCRNSCGLERKRQILAYVEVEQVCVDVCIEDRKPVEYAGTDIQHVTISPEGIALLAEQAGQPVLEGVRRGFFGGDPQFIEQAQVVLLVACGNVRCRDIPDDPQVAMAIRPVSPIRMDDCSGKTRQTTPDNGCLVILVITELAPAGYSGSPKHSAGGKAMRRNGCIRLCRYGTSRREAGHACHQDDCAVTDPAIHDYFPVINSRSRSRSSPE